MEALRSAAAIAVVLLGVGPAAYAGKLLLLVVAAWRYRDVAPAPVTSPPRLVLLVPAHNEARMIATTVAAARRQDYPRTHYRVVVIADNCSDETATRARAAGAEVLERSDESLRGKGYALRWAFDRLLAEDPSPDGIALIDADTVPAADFLQRMADALRAGHEVVQADYVVASTDSSPRSRLEWMAVRLRNHARLAGRSVLRIPASLCGNGMFFSARVLREYPWNAFSLVEDAEYAIGLRHAGFKPHYAGGARVVAIPTGGSVGAYTQAMRWEGGRYYLARKWLAPSIRAVLRGRLDLWDMPFDLLSPPLGLLGTASSAGLALAAVLVAGGLPVWAAASWMIAVGSLALYLVLGPASVGARKADLLALAQLGPPWIFFKLRVYLSLAGRSRSGAGAAWVRTERPGESRS